MVQREKMNLRNTTIDFLDKLRDPDKLLEIEATAMADAGAAKSAIEKLEIVCGLSLATQQLGLSKSPNLKSLKLTEHEIHYLNSDKTSHFKQGMRLAVFASQHIENSSKKSIDKNWRSVAPTTLREFFKLSSTENVFSNSACELNNRSKKIPKNFTDLPSAFSMNHRTRKQKAKDAPRLTVCMSHKDNFDLLRFVAIPSLQNQTMADFTCIIVDDGSSDTTQIWAKIKDEFASDGRFVFLRNANSVGTYAIRNFCLANAKSKYFCIADSDDFQLPNRFEKQISDLKAQDADGVVHNWFRSDSGGRIIYRPDGYIAGIATNSFLHRTSMREQIGYYLPVRFAGDTEYLERARIKNQIHRFKDVVTIGFEGKNNLTTSKETGIFTAAKARQEFYERSKAWHKHETFFGLELSPPFPIPDLMKVTYKDLWRA